jgi:hypothetical protein
MFEMRQPNYLLGNEPAVENIKKYITRSFLRI